MGFKEILKRDFFESENKLLLRYNSSKIVLILNMLIFFISFYFVWAWFYREEFILYMSIIYILLCISIVFYIYFYFKKTFLSKINWVILNFFILILLILFIILMFPALFQGWILWFYNTYIIK